MMASLNHRSSMAVPPVGLWNRHPLNLASVALLGTQPGRTRPLRPKDEGKLTTRVAAGQSYRRPPEIDPQDNVFSEAVGDLGRFVMRGDRLPGELGCSG